MSITMGEMGQDLHNIEKDMEYYAIKLRQVEKRIEFSYIYDLPLTLIMFHYLESIRSLQKEVKTVQV